MVAYLLNLAYAVVLVLAAPWLAWQATRRGKYREGFAAKLWGSVQPRQSTGPCIWLHAVSVGEVNLLGVLLKEAEARRPDVQCVISTTTMTGYALAKQKYAGHAVFYCPLDFSWAVRRAMKRIRPSLLVLAELELWPNLVRAARQQGVRVAIVNGRLSERSFSGYRRIGWLLRPVLNQVDAIAAQNDEYAQRFVRLGAPHERVRVTGSLKFDGAQTDRHNPRSQHLRQLAGIAPDDVVFLAGSTQEPEEQLALEAFRELVAAHPKLRLVIVPRHPHRFDEVAALLDRSGLAWQRRSELGARGQESGVRSQDSPASHQSPFPTPHSPLPILLVNTVGELGVWWGTATIGFVGGSLYSSRGGQNMIEPAAYGVATCFGPNTQNFRDVVAMLLARGAAECVRSGAELTAFVRRCLDDPAYAQGLGRAAAALVAQQQGATARTWQHIEPLLPSIPHAVQREAA